jgi:phosphoketolase
MKMNKKNATDEPLSTELLSKIDAYCRAANYLLVGQGMALFWRLLQTNTSIT